MTFKMTVKHKITPEEAMKSADTIERAVGEICNGKRKAGSIPMQEMCSLIQFVRDAADALQALERVPMTEEQAYDLFGVMYQMPLIRSIEAHHGITPPESNDVLHTE